MSPTVHRINIDQWRSSVPNPDTTAVPPLVGGRFPAHARPVPPPPTTDYDLLHHHSAATRPSLNLTALTAPCTDEEVESRSESEIPSERSSKKEEADRLVDSTLELLLSVWPSPPSSIAALTPPASLASASDAGTDSSDQDAVPLRTFVNEILRRSRSSCATLRAARLYLQRAAALLPVGQERKSTLACPRRTFLSSLILANKFLHDRVYSNRAWGKVSGLQVREISQGETALGDLLGWSLWVGREFGSSDAAVDAALEANAPALIPLADSTPVWQHQAQRMHGAGKRPRSNSASSAPTSLGRVKSSEPHHAAQILAGRTASIPTVVLNGGVESLFTSPAPSSVGIATSVVGAAASQRLGSAFTTLSIFTEVGALRASIEEEEEANVAGGDAYSSDSSSSSDVDTEEDAESADDQTGHTTGQGPIKKRQRLEVVDPSAVSEMEVGWALGLGVDHGMRTMELSI